MREFKFRAYENGTMYYQVRCGGMFDGIATAPTAWSGNNWFHLTGGEHTKVMQYTGLKDKNGKEIYEGDILRYHDNLYIIKCDNYKFYAKDFYEPIQDDPCDIFSEEVHEYSVIIGNIYDNPELIEVKE